MLRTIKNLSTDTRYRWEITFRVITAIFGGYLLTITSGILLAYALPMGKSDAVTTAMLSSFAIYAGAAMWIFSQRSFRKALAGIWIPAIIFTALITLLKLMGVTP
ncbi:hypothetical protein [Cellvibrio mixtus]|uniref:hypothetical protein n=1 Tax=Cellvibrio mixtus TaxID=39650 RepID=UPI00069392E6|nr:hypothetical protein [Cellvibrio mixtus]